MRPFRGGRTPRRGYSSASERCRYPLHQMSRNRKRGGTVTTIKATCPGCGEVELTPDDIELRVCNYAPASYYNFECPTCRLEVRKPADDRVVKLLISGGVREVMWEFPAEVKERAACLLVTLA